MEPPLEARLLTVCNLQEAYAKALLVDTQALAAAQAAGDVVGAHAVLRDAYAADVRPLCAKVRADLGGAADPVAEHRRSGRAERMAVERPAAERVAAGRLGA
jgi:L-rhamnose isomerase/sugar isomerase